MDSEEDAIAQYNRAGIARADGFAGVRWPDILLESANLARVVAGVLGERVDFPQMAFGPDFDSASAADRLEEEWRMEALQSRYAPEGVFVRARFTVRVILAPDNDPDADEEVDPVEETLAVSAETCLSFVSRRHTRPFVDFMGGEIVRTSDGVAQRLDPFAMEISPQHAIDWNLNA